MVRSLLARFSTRHERRLLALCLNNPDNNSDIDQWNKNAVRYLVRELRKDPKLVDELERAITQKSVRSKCIHVTKTSDKRLLVSHRRGLPQVIFCRLWRWPDLQSHHQIKALPHCESSVEVTLGVEQPSNSITVCINPYHYERHKPKPIEPVLVSCSKIPPDLTSSFEDSEPTSATGTKARPGNLSIYQNQFQDIPTMHQEHPESQPSAQNQQQSQQQQSQQHQQQSQQTQPQLQQQQAQQSQYFQHHQPLHVHPQYQPLSPHYTPLDPRSQSQGTGQQQEQETTQHHQHGSPQDQQPIQVAQHQQQTQHPQHSMQLQHQEQSLQQIQRHPYNQGIDQPVHQYTAQAGYPQHPSTTYEQAEYQSQQNQMVYHSPQYIYQDTPPQATTPMLVSDITAEGEVARPYRFKQNRFAHMARARHEHSIVSRYPRYDPHGYISSPYQYSSQPATHIQVTYQARPPATAQQGVGPTMPQQQTNMPYAPSTPVNQYASQQHTAQPTYTTMYSPQQQQTQSQSVAPSQPTTQQPQPQTQYQQSELMQLDYPTEPSLSTTGQQPAGDYYGPVAGPSQEQGDQNMDQTPVIDIQEVPYKEGQYWCSISYHEYGQRIGEKYHSNCRVVSVDGYTQPMCNDRFCIGGISNINRNQFTEWVRRRIGRGVRFTYVDGEVHVEGLSEASVFVSNPLLVQEDGDQLIEHVSKLTLGCTAKVFSTQAFSELLADAVTKGFESVYKLTSCCVIRVSFVKGWGRNYKRASIFNTPCWVEVQLNGPLQWIDKTLRQMRPPTGCGSTS